MLGMRRLTLTLGLASGSILGGCGGSPSAGPATAAVPGAPGGIRLGARAYNLVAGTELASAPAPRHGTVTEAATQEWQRATEILAVLSKWVDRCRLELVQTEAVRTDGRFRLWLQPYVGESAAQRWVFTVFLATEPQRTADWILSLIPGSALPACQVRQEPVPDPAPDPDPTPVPDPAPTPAAIRQHIQSILYFTNERLTECDLYLDGEPAAPAADGFASFSANARYADGTTDTAAPLKASLAVPVERAVQELLALVPSQVFKRCRIAGQGGGEPTPDAGRPLVVNLLQIVNPGLENCLLAISGQTGPVDRHGDFDFYLIAYLADTGSFLDPVRFHGNVHMSPAAAAEVLGHLIPAVEFTKCRRKA